MRSVITAIGTANPQYKRPQQATADQLTARLNLNPVEKRLLKSIYKATGIEHRYSVLNDYNDSSAEEDFFPSDPNANFPSTAARMKIYKDNALSLGLAAIENMRTYLPTFNMQDITHLITVSCTGMYAPGMDIEIVTALQLKPTVKRTCINFMGCYGAFNALKVADSICKAEPNANVLIVSVEICTIHFQKSMHVDNLIANSIFADGAAAVLVQAQSDQGKYLALESFHCNLLPQEKQAMAWHIGDNGFDIVLSSYVPAIIKKGIAVFIQDLLNQEKIALSDIHYYAIHPGGLKILRACEEALQITEAQNKYSYNVLRHYGNMSSATILFVLKSIWDELDVQDHQKRIFGCAFGPGLTLESMLLRTHHEN